MPNMDNTNIEHGNVFNNTFYDDWSSNAFFGYEGNDTFIASMGDSLIHEDSYDWFYGGVGYDTVDYQASAYAVNVDIGNGISIRNPGGLSENWDVLSSIEEVIGSNHNDTLLGDSTVNTFYGVGGHDEIDLAGGDDIGVGGEGNDTINGGEGHDTLVGNNGADSLLGDGGNDSLDAGNGNDIAYGGTGNDTLFGGLNNDSLHGGDHNDLLLGGGNNDSLYGNDHNDTLDGNTGHDYLEGGAGNDSLRGSDGEDTIDGGLGADTIDGGSGNDSMVGHDGNDVFKASIGEDTVVGGEGADIIDFDTNEVVHVWMNGGGNDPVHGQMSTAIHGVPGGASHGIDFVGVEYIRTGGGEDIVYGDDQHNWFATQDGNDSLFGHMGDDTLLAGAGADTLRGGEGSDTLTGGEDMDQFYYVAGDVDSGLDLITDFTGGEDYLAFSDDFFGDLGLGQGQWTDGPVQQESFMEKFFVSGAPTLANSILWAETADGFKQVAEFQGISVGALNDLLDSRALFKPTGVVNPIHKDIVDELFPGDHPTGGGAPGQFQREDEDTPMVVGQWMGRDANLGPAPLVGDDVGDMVF